MTVPEIEVDELARKHGEGTVLVDVREPDEYVQVRVGGALLIPLVDVPERIEEIPEDQTVYVICATGARSARAVDYLTRQGYDAFNVVGGIKRWLEAGHPVEHGPA